jgi:hypothetical protein
MQLPGSRQTTSRVSWVNTPVVSTLTVSLPLRVCWMLWLPTTNTGWVLSGGALDHGGATTSLLWSHLRDLHTLLTMTPLSAMLLKQRKSFRFLRRGLPAIGEPLYKWPFHARTGTGIRRGRKTRRKVSDSFCIYLHGIAFLSKGSLFSRGCWQRRLYENRDNRDLLSTPNLLLMFQM